MVLLFVIMLGEGSVVCFMVLPTAKDVHEGKGGRKN
jgi:hypothetical protein